ncbi:MAG: hypothetical protein LUC88_04745 [Prevotella sp.]|nr:hypothetical protein [Prevotella sp.]
MKIFDQNKMTLYDSDQIYMFKAEPTQTGLFGIYAYGNAFDQNGNRVGQLIATYQDAANVMKALKRLGQVPNKTYHMANSTTWTEYDTLFTMPSEEDMEGHDGSD